MPRGRILIQVADTQLAKSNLMHLVRSIQFINSATKT